MRKRKRIREVAGGGVPVFEMSNLFLLAGEKRKEPEALKRDEKLSESSEG